MVDLNIFKKYLSLFAVIKRHTTMSKVWNKGLSSSFSFLKVFFILMVLMVSSPGSNQKSFSKQEKKTLAENKNTFENL